MTGKSDKDKVWPLEIGVTIFVVAMGIGGGFALFAYGLSFIGGLL